ncbi:MAG: carbohydrate-binding protein [Phycisphaerales bacterium]
MKHYIAIAALAASTLHAAETIHVGFLWHMHQPRYVPDLDPFGSDPFFSFSVPDVHNQRLGPYTTWPANAVNAGSGLPHLGAHVSFSGSLIENLDALEASGINGGIWNNWNSTYTFEQMFTPSSNYTALGNPRLEMIGFGYFHPLMPLIDAKSIHLQIALHQRARAQTFGTPMDSAGLFPPETAFSTRMIPALVDAGLDWVLVDNFHFDRACDNYPHSDASGVYRPNRADQINPDPASTGGRWVQLNNLWAPSRVSVPFGYQPHYAQHVNPDTGAIDRIVAVPAARYEGNEDGRGGYGAFLYDQVMDAYLPDNTDPDHPMLVVLHHDGDNFGGGSEGYYNHNFQNMVNWVSSDPDYDVTTIDDYLARFPVDPTDVIHIEDGSWAGADAGDPEFKKWLGGDVSAGAVSPDINSWAALTAARAWVAQLEWFDAVDPASPADLDAIIAGAGTPAQRAWRWVLIAQASDYWYWDGTEVWDSNVTRASNEACAIVDAQIGSASFPDEVPPTLFVPQREPYNPGGTEFGNTVQPSDFEVWTLAADYTGISSATLKWRADADGVNPLASIQNETYAGGPEVGAWNAVAMTGTAVPTPAGVLAATRKATRYGAMITGQSDVLIDYYVEATDAFGNTTRSDIMHVWVGQSQSTGGEDIVTIDPDPAQANQPVTITYDEAGGPLAGAAQVFIHHGFNDWATVLPDAAMTDPDNDGVWEITLPVAANATSLNIVFNDGANTWDNNGGADWRFTVTGADPNAGFEMDGVLDAEAQLVASGSGLSLWAALDGATLYLATDPASGGNDRFLALAGVPGAMQPAMWAKAGSVAAWDAFVGNEESNGFVGWFDGAGDVALGSVLECTIELTAELGAMPDVVYAAALSYATADSGALTGQAPAAVIANGNVEASEFVEIVLCALAGDCCPADCDANGTINVDDIDCFVAAFLGADLAAADCDASGSLSIDDIDCFVASFLGGCP